MHLMRESIPHGIAKNERNLTMKTTDMTELKTLIATAEAEIKLKTVAYKDLLAADDATQKDLATAETALANAIDEYNELKKNEIYLTCYQAETPMLAACKYGEMTKKVLKKKQNENGTVTISVDDRKARNAIDLVDFEHCNPEKGTLAVNGQWPFYLESWLKSLALNLGTEIELDAKAQNELAAKYKDADGEFANLSRKSCSMKSMVRDLQSIVDCIVFIDYVPKEEPTDESDSKKPAKKLNALKVTSKDVNYIKNRMTKAGKSALAIRMASPKEMRIIVGNVMYHLTTGKPYTIEA